MGRAPAVRSPAVRSQADRAPTSRAPAGRAPTGRTSAVRCRRLRLGDPPPDPIDVLERRPPPALGPAGVRSARGGRPVDVGVPVEVSPGARRPRGTRRRLGREARPLPARPPDVGAPVTRPFTRPGPPVPTHPTVTLARRIRGGGRAVARSGRIVVPSRPSVTSRPGPGRAGWAPDRRLRISPSPIGDSPAEPRHGMSHAERSASAPSESPRGARVGGSSSRTRLPSGPGNSHRVAGSAVSSLPGRGASPASGRTGANSAPTSSCGAGRSRVGSGQSRLRRTGGRSVGTAAARPTAGTSEDATARRTDPPRTDAPDADPRGATAASARLKRPSRSRSRRSASTPRRSASTAASSRPASSYTAPDADRQTASRSGASQSAASRAARSSSSAVTETAASDARTRATVRRRRASCRLARVGPTSSGSTAMQLRRPSSTRPASSSAQIHSAASAAARKGEAATAPARPSS